MRVIECNDCGETLQAANDEELVRALGAHLAAEHGVDAGGEDLTALVEAEAYEATDS
jgi:hypothetical protein